MTRFYKQTVSALLLAGSFLLSQQSEAQVANFTFTGAAGDEATYAPDAQPANATVNSMSRGSGITPSASMNRFSALDFTVGTTNGIDPTEYYTFTITPNSGFQLNLDSIYFTERRSGTGIRNWSLRSSLDNYATNIATMQVPDDTNDRNHALDLNSTFNNLTSAVSFRLYGFNAEALTGTWRIDNVKVTGAVVPTGPSPVVGFTSAAMTVAENAGTATVNVTLANPSATSATTVDVVVTGGTATAGTDFTYTTQTLTFPAGSSANQTVTVTIIDDNDVETSETIVLSLQNATTGVMMGTSTMTITITDNDTPPPAIPLRTIASVTQVDPTTGVALSLGQVVRLRGVNHGVNQRPANPSTTPPTPAAIQWTIIDNTGGIGLFRSSGNLGYNYVEGDSIQVQGTISQFNGLTQLTVDSVWFLTSGNPLVTPTIVTTLGEHTESEVVRLANPVTIVDPAQWTGTGSGFSVDVTDGTNTYVMRIDNDVNLYSMPAPTGYFYLTGIGGQFDSSNPFLSGYQLLPRYATDLEFVPAVGFATTAQSVSEGVGTATLTINLSAAATTPTTLSVAVTGGTATAGTDYTFTTQNVTFAAGSTTPQTVTVTIIDDTQFEADETIIFTIQNVSAGTMMGNATHTLTITNNDPNAIAGNIAKNSLKVYPNPTAGSTTIALDAVAGTSQVQVYNQVGQLVHAATAAEGAANYLLNMENLASGLYTVRVVSADAVKTASVVKH